MRRFVAGLLLALLALLLTPRAWAGDQAAVDAYLRQVSSQVEQPGVYVDPSVLRTGRLTAGQVATLRTNAGQQAADLHIWVLPAARLTLDRGGVGPAHLAYRPADLVVDVQGYFAANSSYQTIVPVRLKDTREPEGQVTGVIQRLGPPDITDATVALRPHH